MSRFSRQLKIGKVDTLVECRKCRKRDAIGSAEKSPTCCGQPMDKIHTTAPVIQPVRMGATR